MIQESRIENRKFSVLIFVAFSSELLPSREREREANGMGELERELHLGWKIISVSLVNFDENVKSFREEL